MVTEREKIDLDEAFQKLFFGCSVNPKVADSDYFKSCIKLLRPSYIPPSPVEITTTLLNKCFENLEKQKKDFKNSAGILHIITVKEDQSKAVISLICHLDYETTFLKSFLLQTTTSGVEYDKELNEKVLASLNIAKNIYRLYMYAIVSKEPTTCLNINCNVMLSMCNIEIVNFLVDSVLDNKAYQKANLILEKCKKVKTYDTY